MEFNNYVWNLYRSSSAGMAAIKRDVSEHALPESRRHPPFHTELFFLEVEAGNFVENGSTGTDLVDLRKLVCELPDHPTITNAEEAEAYFVEIADKGLSWTFDEDGKTFEAIFAGGKDDVDGYVEVINAVDGLTSGLHDVYPEFFLPYLFQRRFDLLERICRAFDISLPELPGKLQKRERAMYYLAINRVIQNFRQNHGLSPQELNAFLYDFAPNNITIPDGGPLPQPSRVWFVIGGVGKNGDFEYLDAAETDAISYWQGNLETRRGDIVLMWCASPRSYLHSVWRALDEGFIDPYFHYYTMIRVGNHVKIAPLSFSEFSKHPLLGTKPSVKAHFQGRSGTAISLEEYSAICDLLREKRFDVSQLPSPPDVREFPAIDIENERGVELNLLEPLLRNLGHSENDWVRQLSVRMGRGERNYPDYVLGCDPRPGEESGAAIIECKFDIDSKKELKETFIQAKSYALRLQASILVLAARRGLWVYTQRADGFSIEHFTFKTWNELSHPDVLHAISVVIGKRAIATLAERRSKVRRKARP